MATYRPALTDETSQIPSSSSILSPRSRVQPTLEHFDKPLLLTMLDTEESFDWDKPFTRSATDVTSMVSQVKAHRVFERYGVVPTYLVDYPVVSQDAGRAPLLDMLRDRLCDVGTHLHPWVTPPFLEEVNNRNSYPGNLPLELEFAKLQTLTGTIEDLLGLRPQVYRAGRYGVGPRTGDLLRHLGYLVDSSVMANWDFTAQDGPDFTAISAEPYWIDQDRSILEIPCTAAVVGSAAWSPELVHRAVFSPTSKRLGIPSVTARLRLMERIRLTPEGITVTEGKRLLRYMHARGHKVFVLTYHTPSLVPGNTPYVRSTEDLARFLRWLDEIYDFFTTEICGRCATWRDVHAAITDVAQSRPTTAAVPEPLPLA